MLSNAYFLAKFRFNTAESEPAKNLQNFANFPNFANADVGRAGVGPAAGVGGAEVVGPGHQHEAVGPEGAAVGRADLHSCYSM